MSSRFRRIRSRESQVTRVDRVRARTRLMRYAAAFFLAGAFLAYMPARVAIARAGTQGAGPTPALAFLRLVGGSRAEQDARLAVGGSGNIFLAGTTFSADWPAPWRHACAIAPPAACGHPFVLELSRDGMHTWYGVVLGGSRQDAVTGLAVDRAGNAYVTGTTNSLDFPTVNALQRRCGGPRGGCVDGFAAKIDPRGRVVYSTYLGGSGDDHPSSVAVDRNGDAYVAGSTTSRDFPLRHPMQSRPHGESEGFVARLSASGRRLVYSTYLGGSRHEAASAIAVNRLGEAFVVGSTDSPDFRTSAHALQPKFVGGNCAFFGCDDAFVTKLGAAGRFLAGTFLATRANDLANAVTVDGNGNVYVGGSTGAARIPSGQETVTTGKNYCGEEGDIFPCQSAYVAEMSPRLDRLVYSMMLSGNGLDRVDGLAVTADGALAVGGYTESTNFPTVNPTQPGNGGGECSEGKGGSAPCDGFVAVVTPGGRARWFGSYVGGNGQDDVTSVALDPQGSLVIAGTTWSGNLTSQNNSPPLQAPRVFLGRIDCGLPACRTLTPARHGLMG